MPSSFPAVRPARDPVVLVDRCVCRQKSFAELLPLARAGGWGVAELGRQTGCGDQCGLCRPYLRRMLSTGETAFGFLLPPDAA
jgi:bacterioferritin-associated ferredoxin